MVHFVRIGACQPPEIIGNSIKALGHIIKFAEEAENKSVDILLFPECFLTGYILDKTFVENNSYNFESFQFAEILKRLKHIKPTLVFGANERKENEYFNSVVVVNNGELIGVYRKTHLVDPNEMLFKAGENYPIFEVKGLKFGINICYDSQFADAAKAVANQGARLLLLPAQNMLRNETAEYWKEKHNEIRSLRVKETGLWFISSDVTGIRPAGQYGVERIGYGPTLAMNPKAEIVAQVPLLTVGMITVDIPV